MLHATDYSNPVQERRNALMPMAEPGTLGDLLRLMVRDLKPLPSTADSTPIALWRVREGATLIHEGTSTQTLFVLRCGSLKCVKTLEDGYEQVLSFVQAGELLGFEALHGGVRPAGVVALEDTSVYALPMRDLPRLRERCPALNDALQRALSRQLVNAAAVSELMAAVSSEARLARFLLWWSDRMVQAGQSPRRLWLRMGRRDIASLIGVAHATVSRSFTSLAEAGVLLVDNREVEILDIDALRARARSTRGLATDHGDGGYAAGAAARAAANSQRMGVLSAWPSRLGEMNAG